MWETLTLFSLSVLLIMYLGLKYHYNYWRRKNIPHVASNILDFEWYTEPSIKYYAKVYHKLKGCKFGGLYAKFTPKLMVRDPELIKRVLVKDFDYFLDRGDAPFDENEPLTMHLFSAPGPFWRKLRPKLTTMFTPGKLRSMFCYAEESAKELIEEIRKRIEFNNSIKINDYCLRYVVEVIFLYVYGLKANAIKDDASIIKKIAKNTFSRNLSAKFILITESAFPWLKKALGVSFISEPASKFFRKLTQDLIHCRKTNDIVGNNFFEFMMNMKDETSEQNDGESLVLTDELILAQCFIFFGAGFETSTMTMSLIFYELAANLDVQRKLQNEIDECLQKNDHKVTYEMLRSMPYLKQVVSETSRKYPVGGVLSRFCVRRYKIPDTEVFIEKGTEVLIPVAGLYSDPEYFPNPERFDPDRFEDSLMSGREVYMPFGTGPRNCVGAKMAQMMVKMGIVYLLRDFNFELCSMTRSPVEFKPFKMVTSINHDIILKCCSR